MGVRKKSILGESMSEFSDFTLDILKKRFLIKDELGNVIETPDELFWRVANAVSFAEKESDRKKWAEIFYNMMSKFEFVPNTPTLANAGRQLGQMSACFVIPIGDSMEDIFNAVKYTAIIHKSGGGCFDENTVILTKDGGKKISEVKEKDEILCYDFNEEKSMNGVVIGKYEIDVTDKEIVEVEFDDGYIVKCTYDHPFMIMEKGIKKWIAAGELTDDMEVINIGVKVI